MSKSSSNKKYSGFISSFEPARSKKLLRNLEKGGDFSDSFSIDDWELDKREIFLLVLESNPAKLNGAAFVERSYGNGGTGKPKFSFSNLLSFGEPILIANIENQSGELSALISNFSKGGKRLEDDEWAELVSIIKRLRPGIASDLDELISLVFKDADLVDDTENRIMRLAEQRDAIGMATDIAGCDRKFVMKSINATDAQTADSILDLIEDFTLDERSHVEKDSELIRRMLGEDLDKIKYKKIADENDRKVTVFVIDKTKLETVLGTDLLIYQSLFKSFILVQYKLMDYIKKGTIKGWSFMPDTQFEKQVATIKNNKDLCKSISTEKTEWDLRLNNDPYYFKFCEKRKNSSREDSLVKGINIPFSHLEKYLNFNNSANKRIGYQNCSRYFNNSEFITLAKGGWIGSNLDATVCIEKILRNNREGGRNSILVIVDVPEQATAELRKIN